MSLILKQETSGTVTTPASGKGSVFLDTNNQLNVKDSTGNTAAIPTLSSTTNTDVLFNDNGALGQSANFTFNKSTNVLNVNGNIATTGIKTDNYYYANGSPLDMQQPAGSNTQIQYNNNNDFGASSNFTFNSATNQLGVTGTISASGNVTTGNVSGTNGVFTYVSGNGYQLSSITGSNVTGTVANATYAITSGSATTAGTVTTAAQPNITSVGTLSSLSVSGNSNVGNIGATNGVFTYVSGNGYQLSSITGSNVTGTVANATYAVSAGTAGSATTAGTVTTAAQPNITSTGTLTSLSVSGNANVGNLGTAGQIISSIATGTAPFTVASTTKVTNLNVEQVDGYHADTANTVSTIVVRDASSNISVGNISTVGMFSTTVSATGNGIFGNVNATLFAGNLSGTGNSNVGNLGATGVYATTLSSTGNTTAGNLVTDGKISATGNLTAATGTFTAGLNVTGNISASGNINYQSVTNLDVGDPLIYIGANNTGNLVDLGLVASYNDGSYKHTGIARNTTNGIWTFFDGVANEPTTVIDWANATYPTVKVGALQATSTISVTGNANVGNIGAAAGVFTSVSGSGAGLTTLNASNLSSGTIASGILGNSTVYVGTTAVALNRGSASLALTGITSIDGYAATVSTAAQPNITSVGTLTSLSSSGNITAANVTVASGTVGGATAIHYGTTLTTGANTTAGTVTGNWSLSAGSRLNATYADLAENYVSDSQYPHGTVLIFGGDFEVTQANTFDSTRVAGVVSENPAYIMNSDCQGEFVVPLALQGRVPVKVKGPVYKGDLMVTAPDGYAIANNIARAGTIIGKALENFDGAEGVIEVVVGRV